MFLKWLFGKGVPEGKSIAEECQFVVSQVDSELEGLVPHLKNNWTKMSDSDLALDEESLPTGVEACLWSLYFLKMVEEAESRKIDGVGVSERLEEVQSSKDSQGTGCRIRYARGILQDYAASGRGYDPEQKALFVGEWLFNCNKDAMKGDKAPGSISAYRKIGKVLLGDDTKRKWF